MGYFGSFRRIFKRVGSNARKASDELVALSRSYNPPGGRIDLGSLFSPTRVTAKDGQLFVGRLPAVEFDRFVRLGDIANSFRRALPDAVDGNIGILGALNMYGRQAQKTLPDLPVTNLNTKTANLRKKLKVSDTTRVTTADDLATVIGRDPELVRAINRRARNINRTRTIKMVGSAIGVAVGVTVTAAFLYQVAARLALRSTGCFMYRGGEGTRLVKCKLSEMSCSSIGASLPDGVLSCMQTNDLPAELFSQTVCLPPNESAKCVHCNPDEKDPTALGWTYADRLPEDVILRCESKDALDVIGDIMDDVIDGIGDIIQNPIGSILSCVGSLLIWIVVAVIVIVVVYAFARSLFTSRGNNNTVLGVG